MKRKIFFITTGDIKNIATSKRALGMANPLTDLGWDVSIIMQDTEENRHRVSIECNEKVNVIYFNSCTAFQERKIKRTAIKKINPDYIYICAFVTRNIVGNGCKAKILVEHSELQSGIHDMRGLAKIKAYFTEYLSIFYSDALINASKFLQDLFLKRCASLFRRNLPNFYHPYAFSSNVIHPENINREERKYSSFKDRKIFTFLGTITRNYGAFTIIEAVEKAKAHHPEILVFMYGRGRHYQEAVDYVKEHQLEKWVQLPGFIREEEIFTCFSLTDYFISPMNDTVQDWARCPSKLYMYLPYQKPIVTCKIGEPYEVLKNEGDYYTPSDPGSMAQTMEKLIESRKTKINIDPIEHSWETRTKQFDQWIKNTFTK